MSEGKIAKIATLVAFTSLSLLWLSSLNSYTKLSDGPSLKFNETQTAIIIESFYQIP